MQDSPSPAPAGSQVLAVRLQQYRVPRAALLLRREARRRVHPVFAVRQCTLMLNNTIYNLNSVAISSYIHPLSFFPPDLECSCLPVDLLMAERGSRDLLAGTFGVWHWTYDKKILPSRPLPKTLWIAFRFRTIRRIEKRY